MHTEPFSPIPTERYSMDTLVKNLEAAATHQPQLVRRISWPVDGSHVTFDENGAVLFHLNLSSYSLNLSLTEEKTKIQEIADGKDFFVFGIGLGEQVDILLDLQPERKITAWEKDPWLLRLLLMQKDYSEAVSQGRLHFTLGTDLIRALPDLDRFTLVFHPFLKKVYHNEAGLIASGIREKRALLNTGGLFVDDVADALKNMGFTTYYLNFSGLSMEEIDHSIIQFRPHMIFSVNYQNGLSELCNNYSLPLICWEIDHMVDALKPVSEDYEKTHIFTYRKRSQNEFRAAGFSRVHYLPMGANTEKRKPSPLSEQDRERYICPVSFVGNILAEQAAKYVEILREIYSEYRLDFPVSHEDPFERMLHLQHLDYTVYILPELFGKELPDFDHYFRVKSGSLMDPVKLLAESAAARKRLAYVSQLGRYGIKVWGDEGWKQVEGSGARYMGPAGHHHELNKIYNGSLINLEINRIYQPDVVNMRVFDIMACGGFALVEYSKELEELFDLDREVVAFYTPEDMVKKVEYYLSHPEETDEIAQRGLAAVRNRHTIRHRVEEMSRIAGVI